MGVGGTGHSWRGVEIGGFVGGALDRGVVEGCGEDAADPGCGLVMRSSRLYGIFGLRTSKSRDSRSTSSIARRLTVGYMDGRHR